MSSMTVLAIQFVLRLVLALAFVGMGITHFLPGVQRTMSAMIPPGMRFSRPFSPPNLVVFTGVCEIAGGIGLLWPPTTVVAGVCLVIFLAVVFPANAYAARHRERFGRVAIPVLPRLAGQLTMMALLVLAIV